MESPTKPRYAADTVALILRLENRRLGTDAAEAFSAAEQNRAVLYIPAFVFAEVMYLSEKQRISISITEVAAYIELHSESVHEAPLDSLIVRTAQQITDVPELHDRLIAATARAYAAVLITNDSTLRASQFIQTIW